MIYLKRVASATASFLFPKWYNKRMCSKKEQWNGYFDLYENDIEHQWQNIIWPLIKDFDFNHTLELAPGAGRNTKKLVEVSKHIYAVDFNEYALDRLRKRFEDYKGECRINIFKNNGSDLNMIADESVTAVYSWDSVVHFDKTIVKDYIKEFSRVMVKGAYGFVHHSDLGEKSKPYLKSNPGSRSNMTKSLFAEYCNQNNLTIVKQVEIPWGEIYDCISIFKK